MEEVVERGVAGYKREIGQRLIGERVGRSIQKEGDGEGKRTTL